MSNISNYVLVIPSWYPSNVHKFNGDFNKRFVNAIAIYQKQIVLYVVFSPYVNKIQEEIVEFQNLKTIIVYYPDYKFKIFNKIIKGYFYLKLNLLHINKILKEDGKPKLIHCYIFFPAGLIAVFFKFQMKIKLVLTENWTSFYKEDPNYLGKSSCFKRKLYEYILNSFSVIMPVAKKLEVAINNWTKEANQIVIPNVVDTKVFFHDNKVKKEEIFTFLHVSTMGYQKNVEGIIEVFERILKQGISVKLILIGPQNDNLLSMINDSIILSKNVKYLGEMENTEVAYWMKKCHSLLLFSRFENLPCVILEALCCGLPILSTNVGGTAEVINHNNGLLLNSEDKITLEKYICLIQQNTYNHQEISETAISLYSYQAISEKINAIYNIY